jgi:hypothetical protein
VQVENVVGDQKLRNEYEWIHTIWKHCQLCEMEVDVDIVNFEIRVARSKGDFFELGRNERILIFGAFQHQPVPQSPTVARLDMHLHQQLSLLRRMAILIFLYFCCFFKAVGRTIDRRAEGRRQK